MEVYLSEFLLLVAHAPSPNTQAILTAMTRAWDESLQNLPYRAVSPFETDASLIMDAKGIVLFTPENFGYMSGALKDMFDRIYYDCLDNTQGLPYCLCVRAGQDDGSGTEKSVKRITTGLRWREVQPPLICSGPYRDDFPSKAAEFATGFALGVEMGIF